MKRIFLVVALAIVGLFVYTVSLAQYISLSFLFDLLPNYWVFYVIIVFLWLLALVIALRVVLKPTFAYKKTYWLLIILLNPILGILLYYIFARDFVTRKFYKTRPLIAHRAFLGLEETTSVDFDRSAYGDIFRFIREVTGRAIYENDTHVEILNNGDQFFPRLIEELKRAKSYIFMEFYIIKTDEIGRQVLDVLKEKAEAGLDVHLIYDHFGSNRHLDRKYLSLLKKSGVKIGVFDPQTLSVFNSNVNFRNHRKAIVIDGNSGFVGGMNLADEYNHKSRKFGFWRDTHVAISGNGVTAIQNIFVKDWYYITGEVLDMPMDKTVCDFNGLFSVIESGPDFEDGLIRDCYLRMIQTAKKSIRIVTPYLIIEPELLSMLQIASKSGVEISLLVPGKSDYAVVGYATRSYYEPLLRMGARIYEYKNHFVHSKILLIDDALASVGTVNFDPRSFHLNFELTAIFENPAVKLLADSFQRDLMVSEEIVLEKWEKRGIFRKLIQGLFNLFSPIF
ncbi:MAG: cardiolipin synthase [Candidatus Izemoplasmatales bacterium]|jgi:cardiolipin synthase|nr:cardiolipin synthase [Candidatus Izemoplasmatales bacterium]MDD4987850.1 cardiolipin synthase [Candidatus Izemoplasmatales bacterium]MDY0373318.1 cardiolipin synthase [Candidatus Izemoplasmatales bacterium]NLF48945.1 cardiolipin synthase [Acholeplasmataceae bacterium]